jgi:thymidylate kinase
MGVLMSTVALIGPDGAGKSTILEEIELQSEFPVKRIYMGIRLESSNIVLPTTRLLLYYRKIRAARSRGIHSNSENKDPSPRFMSRIRSTLLLLNLIAESWFRQVVAWQYQRQGYLVLFDRHFIADYHAFNHADPRLGNFAGTRLHRFILDRFFPRPDIVICLDAPAEVLVARKPELPPERIELLREGYLSSDQLFPQFFVVDVSQPKDTVVTEVITLIQQSIITKS